ncbi:hypothetical protein EHW67_17295 [Arenibacter aquaticus]|uniref:Uncharacterized protein n=1 Tax=Arenibacter aquaticus TaxID=2489054 RepID=A0A3S0ABY4_9FLAO|nr:hypothetical protein [Arenibacter aquaticus]RTE51958.1 hypothetical protein EHW67_17295 [Arenibacter aquaticus]
MSSPSNLLLPKTNVLLTIVVLLALIVLSFYGMYGNTFFFNKAENYIFPLLTLTHFLYLYVLWFKITEREYPDSIMKNIEYIMYGIVLVYGYEIFSTYTILSTHNEFQDHVIPNTFMPMGILIVTLQTILVCLSIWSFAIRKIRVGKYDFDYLNNHLDAWE